MERDTKQPFCLTDDEVDNLELSYKQFAALLGREAARCMKADLTYSAQAYAVMAAFFAHRVQPTSGCSGLIGALTGFTAPLTITEAPSAFDLSGHRRLM